MIIVYNTLRFLVSVRNERLVDLASKATAYVDMFNVSRTTLCVLVELIYVTP